MLTRFVRIQLAIFTIASIVGVAVMVFGYMQVPTLLGIGRITVRLELPATGGLYRFANVTYRGVHVGKVTAVGLSSSGVKATLSLGNSPRIPADLTAVVGSMSAVGEQYVDLQPRTDSPPYLRDGSVIAMGNTTTPQQVGPLLDQVSALIGSIPKDKLSQLLDDSFRGFNGSSYDLGSLSDSAAKISADLNSVADRARTLTEDTVPLVDSQAQTADSIRTWARSLAGVSQQVATDDPQVRTLLRAGPNAADEASRLLNQIKPTLHRPGRSDIHPIAGAAAGVASAVCGFPSGGGAHEESDRYAASRFPLQSRRSAGVHRWLPAGQPDAVPSRHLYGGHAGRAVLQATAGFTGRCSRRPQQPLHGPPR